jgi:cell division transport system permease protein
MKIEALKRVIGAGWTNFCRNKYVSFGTTGVMVLVLLLFLGLVVVNFMTATVVVSLRDKVDISVYFKTEATESEIFKVKEDLEDLGSIRYVEYVSREQALSDFKERHAGDALIQESLAELGGNPLQASLNVKAHESSEYENVVGFLEANSFRVLIDKINFYENEQVIGRVESISMGLQNWGFIATLLLALIAVLVTFNTVRLTIYSQKQEIEIMRLVGGSNWHVRAPYLIEGTLYGIFAALIALAIFYPTIYFASPKVETLIPGIGLMSYFISNALQFSLLILVVGIILGVISSSVAIRKFLKV